MKGVKELKARIKSIGNIRKVTSTMELVATTKMKKLQGRAEATRPFADAIRAMMSRVARHAPEDTSPLLVAPSEVKRECVIVIGGTKGLCGPFNSNLSRKAVSHVREVEKKDVEVDVYTLGRRATLLFQKIKQSFAGSYDGRLEYADYRAMSKVMASLAESFVEGNYQRVSLVYTAFESVVKFVPTVETLLPLAALPTGGEEEGDDAEVAGGEIEYIMEPSPKEILARLIPKSLEMKFFNAVLESLASEFAARRIAMKNATDAAGDMIDDLTREYNKARQAGITAELLEIAAGAEALKG